MAAKRATLTGKTLFGPFVEHDILLIAILDPPVRLDEAASKRAHPKSGQI